jgi:hypothetical protein
VGKTQGQIIMKTLIFILVIALVGCTTTHVKRVDGDKSFEASNTSIGWDRENIRLDLNKAPDKVKVGIRIGKSGGAAGLDRAITGLENALEGLKDLRP